MSVISASRRTDIPAFYADWLVNRVRAGFCHWRHPFTGQVYRVSLAPEDVIAYVFWTRNPSPLLPHLPELETRGCRYYVQFTITGYGAPLELYAPTLDAAIRAFRATAAHVGPERVIWRYDPIVISSITPPAAHAERFERIAAALAGYTRRCTFSFLDLYGKTRRNLARLTQRHGITFEPLADHARRALVAHMAAAAAENDMQLVTCCEDDHERVPGVCAGSCVDLGLLRRLTHDPALALPQRPTRDHCGCVKSVDIGAYDTCLFGCAYCYATNSRTAARRRRDSHDPADTILYRPDSLRGVDLDAAAH
ncbi:MAG: DUF1848 domain-containing protein [Anaerolineae bacterium]|nr:DUF1848 domain-containing protein [Anaerolineae bacterium]